MTILLSEDYRTAPQIRYQQAVLDFPGNDPESESKTLVKMPLKISRRRGLQIRDFAGHLDASRSSV